MHEHQHVKLSAKVRAYKANMKKTIIGPSASGHAIDGEPECRNRIKHETNGYAHFCIL